MAAGGQPVEIAPGRGDLRYSSFSSTIRRDLGSSALVGRSISYADLFATQPWIAAAVGRMLTWAVRVPLKCYRRDADESRQQLRPADHPLARLIQRPWLGVDGGGPANQSRLIQALLGPVLVHGNAVLELTQVGGDDYLIPLDWRYTTPIGTTEGNSIDGWRYQHADDRRDVSITESVHLAWWSPLGPLGISPLEQLGTTVAIEDAAQRYQRSLFANGARPPSAITTSPEFLTMEGTDRTKMLDQLRQDVDELYAGPDRAGKPALLPPGLEWKSVGHSAVEAALIDQRKIAREEVAAVYQIPPPMMGVLDNATYCLPAESLVMTERGSRPIVGVEAGDRVWSLKDGALSLEVVSESRQTGVKPLLTVKTQNRTLRCTDNHPVLVTKRLKGDRTQRKATWGQEWIPAGELCVGDLLVTATELPEHGVRSCPTREVTEGFAEFCGLLLGDGNVHRDSVSIARSDDARYMDHYRQGMEAEFEAGVVGGAVATAPVRLQEGVRTTRFSSRAASRELTELGLSGTAHTKSVPEWVFQLAPDLRAAFLRGFCDADGSVDKKGHLSAHSANEVLLRQVRELFIGLGVPVCNIRAQRGWVKLPDGRKVFSVMWTFKASNPEVNAAVIGSRDPSDLGRMRAGKPWAKKAYRYADKFAGAPVAPAGCGHARVRSVERGEIGVPVYDLTVPGTHSFIAEGVVVHNSNIQTQREMAYTDAIGPPLVLIEQALTSLLARDHYGDDDVYVEFDFGPVLRGDRLKEINAFRFGIGSAIYTANEARRALNLPPSDAPMANELLYPSNNLAPLSNPPPLKNAPPSGRAPTLPNQGDQSGDGGGNG